MIHWGGNPEIPQVLGGEIEFYIGGQPITFNTTTGIFIPKGTPHGPMTWKKFEFPHIQMNLILGSGSYEEAWGMDYEK
jgi:quercetin dioxygenase-like cupin family protein